MRALRMSRACLATLLVLSSFCGCVGGSFTVTQTWKDGHALVATIDTSFRDAARRVGFPWFVSLTTPILHPTKDGLTTDEEAPFLNDWEDDLEKEFAGECRF